MGTWKATPVEVIVITKEGGGFAYKLSFTPEDTVNYSEAVVENLMIYIHVDYKPVVPTDAPAPTETPAPTDAPAPTEALAPTDAPAPTEPLAPKE